MEGWRGLRRAALLTAFAALLGILAGASVPGETFSRVATLSPEPSGGDSQIGFVWNVHPDSDDGGLGRDAEMYAREYGVSHDEAVQRLKAQLTIGQLVQTLETLNPDRLAGVWLEHSPEFRLVAWYSGGPDGLDSVRAAMTSAPLPVQILTGATNSLQELVDSQLKAVAALSPDIRPVGAWVEVQRGVIHVDLAPDTAARDTESLARALRQEFGRPVEITVLPQAVSDDSTYGGTKVFNPTTGAYCTGAFTVANYAGATGLLTAGHCDNTLTYDGPDGQFATTFVAEVRDAYRDTQWSSVVGTEYAKFYDGTVLRNATATLSRLQQPIGQYSCHFGWTSWYSCGTLQSKTYQPTYPGACPSTCGASWMMATGYYLYTAGGDSGGPWFVAGTALGVHKGSQFGGTYVIYMAIDYIEALGIYVLLQ